MEPTNIKIVLYIPAPLKTAAFALQLHLGHEKNFRE
jgi:hypothetical protein